MKPVKLSELLEALEFDSDDYACWVDLQNGTVLWVENSLLGAVEEGDEDSLDNWEKEDIETARAIAADSEDRFIKAPEKFDFHEYRHMEKFIATVEDAAAADQLWQAIKGKGAFRYFKDTAHRLDLLESWYEYRNKAMKTFIQDWAEAYKIPLLDDAKPGRP